VGAVAWDGAGIGGIKIARDAGLPAAVFARAEHPSASARDDAMFAWLHQHAPQLFVLAGYLALLHLDGVGGLPVLNIHPSLLPRHGGKGFYGDRVHRAVLQSGDAVSGATVHLVDAAYDRGKVVAQAEVPVLPGDDAHALADRVFATECELYPRVLDAIASGRLRIVDGELFGTV
jgi:phosphoribosylglycinamide formyltransferase-1